jgi:hypothetical protein
VARIKGPTNIIAEIRLGPAAGPAGNFGADYEPVASGRYEISVTAKLADTTLSAPPLEVDVGRPNLEFDRLDLDEKMLAAIADRSGGRYAHITTADRLVDRLKRRNEKRQVQYELPLSWPPLSWLLFVALLTTEWVLRRRFLLR